MTKLWDSKDVRIIANAIRDVAPNDPADRADLIIAAAIEAGVGPIEIKDAADRNFEADMQPMSPAEIEKLIVGR